MTDQNPFSSSRGFFSRSRTLQHLLWCLLTCVVLCSFFSLTWRQAGIESNEEKMNARYGAWDTVIYNVPQQKRESLEIHPGTRISSFLPLSSAKAENGTEIGTVTEYNENFFDLACVKYILGRPPQEPGEAVITESVWSRIQSSLDNHRAFLIQSSTTPEWNQEVKICGIIKDYGQEWIHRYQLPVVFLMDTGEFPAENTALYLKLKTTDPKLQEEMGLDKMNVLNNISRPYNSPEESINLMKTLLGFFLWFGILLISIWFTFYWLHQQERQIRHLYQLGIDENLIRKDITFLMVKPLCVLSSAVLSVSIIFQTGLLLPLESLLLLWSAALVWFSLTSVGIHRLFRRGGSYKSQMSRNRARFFIRKRKNAPVMMNEDQIALRLFWLKPFRVLVRSCIYGLLITGMIGIQVQMIHLENQNSVRRWEVLIESSQESDEGAQETSMDQDSTMGILEQVSDFADLEPFLFRDNVQMKWSQTDSDQKKNPEDDQSIITNAVYVDFDSSSFDELKEQTGFDPDNQVLMVSSSLSEPIKNHQTVCIETEPDQSIERELLVIDLRQASELGLNSFIDDGILLDLNVLDKPNVTNRVLIGFHQDVDRGFLKKSIYELPFPDSVIVKDLNISKHAEDDSADETFELSLVVWIILAIILAAVCLMDTLEQSELFRKDSMALYRVGIDQAQIRKILIQFEKREILVLLFWVLTLTWTGVLTVLGFHIFTSQNKFNFQPRTLDSLEMFWITICYCLILFWMKWVILKRQIRCGSS